VSGAVGGEVAGEVGAAVGDRPGVAVVLVAVVARAVAERAAESASGALEQPETSEAAMRTAATRMRVVFDGQLYQLRTVPPRLGGDLTVPARWPAACRENGGTLRCLVVGRQ
jgi:hypothetical protein